MRWFTVIAVALALGLASAASPFASSSPDGLARVAADHGFAARGEQRSAPVRLATGLAGFAGTLLVFGIGVGVAKAVRRR